MSSVTSPDPGASAGPTPAAAGAAADQPPPPPGWVRNVTLFLTGQTVSLFGSMLVQYAVMWYITLETRSATLLALSAVFGFLPQAIVSIFGGVWADRHNRKFLIIAADAGIALATLALALAMLGGATNIWLIFAAMAVRSTGAGVQTPAVSALIPQIVPAHQLLRINGLNQSIQAAMMIVSPAVAAVLYANFPLQRIFFVDVATAVVGIGLLALIPVAGIARADDGAARPSYLADLVEGMRYARDQVQVRWLVGLCGIIMVLAGAPSFLTPLLLADSFGPEVWKLTVLELAFSIGMLLAGATIGFWGPKFLRAHLVVAASVAFGVVTIGLGVAPVLWVYYAFMFCFGIAVPAFSTPMMTALQELVPAERQGRVFGLVGIVMSISMPVGMGLFGPLGDVWSVPAVLVLAGTLAVVATAVLVGVPTGRSVLAEARGAGSPLGRGSAES